MAIDVMRTSRTVFSFPIIAISGIYKKSEIKDRMDDIYIDGFFEKPLDLDEMSACIRSILNG